MNYSHQIKKINNMQNMGKLDNVLRLLLVIISGFSLYFLFNMNESLSDVKDNLGNAQKEVNTAQDSIRIMQARIDSLLKTTQDAKVKMVDLEKRANQVKTVYIDRTKKDNETVSQADNVLKTMKEKKKKASNLDW